MWVEVRKKMLPRILAVRVCSKAQFLGAYRTITYTNVTNSFHFVSILEWQLTNGDMSPVGEWMGRGPAIAGPENAEPAA